MSYSFLFRFICLNIIGYRYILYKFPKCIIKMYRFITRVVVPSLKYKQFQIVILCNYYFYSLKVFSNYNQVLRPLCNYLKINPPKTFSVRVIKGRKNIVVIEEGSEQRGGGTALQEILNSNFQLYVALIFFFYERIIRIQ